MSFSWSKTGTIAEREYLTTVKRKAFLFSVLGIPALYAVLMMIMVLPQIGERARQMREFKALGVVDSSGAFADAELEIRGSVNANVPPMLAKQLATLADYRIEVKRYATQAEAERALRAGEVTQTLIIPADYLETGRIRRYVIDTNMFSSADQRALSGWLVKSLLRGQVDSLRIERVARPTREMALYRPNPAGGFELHDDRREMLDFLVPFGFAFLMGLGIVIGGQYLLQGVSEEKESRILESMLCTVNAQELLAGKLLGLGGAGLTIVGSWLALGALVSTFGIAATGGALLAQVGVSPLVIAIAIAYFLLGYLFYGSIMTGIGAITNNMREAQQFSFFFTFMNFIPFYLITTIIGRPNSGLAMGLSFFPPMAPVTMMLRLCAPSASVPAWQIALSIALLLGTAWLTLMLSARLFRIGLLMYGKTPTLPEIMRWARQG